MGLPASARMSRGDLVRAVDGRRFRASSGPVTVQLSALDRPGSAGHEVKVAFAIGKPVGGAVVRNRVRRRLRVGIRSLVPLVTALPDGSGRLILMVVRVTPEAAAMSAAELNGHVRSAVRRAVDRLAATDRRGIEVRS